MLKNFEGLKGALKVKPDAVFIDNNVFRLHYKVTAVMLMVFSVLVTAEQFVKDPIYCVFDKKISKDWLKALQTFCWISSTYTIPSSIQVQDQVGIQPGVAPVSEGDEVQQHKYYQWVVLVLFFQAMLFYIPRFLWKNIEGGLMKMLVKDLQCAVVTKKSKDERKKFLVDYLHSGLNSHSNNAYAFRYFACEILNFLNVIGQIFLMDKFLDGQFSTYGSEVFNFMYEEPQNRVDPMSKVFPKLTMCTFHKYGPSGSLATFQGLCVLPLNMVNEKIYVVLWVWFMFLSTITGIMVLYRLCTLKSAKLRLYALCFQARSGVGKRIKKIMKHCQTGDWFILYQMSKNINSVIFEELIVDFAQKFDDFAQKMEERTEVGSQCSLFLPAVEQQVICGSS